MLTRQRFDLGFGAESLHRSIKMPEFERMPFQLKVGHIYGWLLLREIIYCTNGQLRPGSRSRRQHSYYAACQECQDRRTECGIGGGGGGGGRRVICRKCRGRVEGEAERERRHTRETLAERNRSKTVLSLFATVTDINAIAACNKSEPQIYYIMGAFVRWFPRISKTECGH